MFEKIRDKILEYVDVPKESVTMKSTFLADLNMSSLDIMTLIGELEDEYDIEIPNEDLASIFTIEELINYLEKRIGNDR